MSGLRGFRAMTAKAEVNKDVKTPFRSVVEPNHAVNGVAICRETRIDGLRRLIKRKVSLHKIRIPFRTALMVKVVNEPLHLLYVID